MQCMLLNWTLDWQGSGGGEVGGGDGGITQRQLPKFKYVSINR